MRNDHAPAREQAGTQRQRQPPGAQSIRAAKAHVLVAARPTSTRTTKSIANSTVDQAATGGARGFAADQENSGCGAS
jgi:hypothetical protein